MSDKQDEEIDPRGAWKVRKKMSEEEAKESIKASQRAHYYRNREKRLMQVKEWRAKNKDKSRENLRQWREKKKQQQRQPVIIIVEDGQEVQVPEPTQITIVGTLDNLQDGSNPPCIPKSD
jgi:hypothetical protein